MNDFIPFALPDIGTEEIDEVVDTLRSGWITSGPKVQQFERDFSNFLAGNVESIAVNSATAGLHLALEACGIGPGDEVITTTHTFTATAEVVRYLGADPVFVDICRDTYCIDPALIARAITKKTKAILPVHYGGLPCDMESIWKIAEASGLRVIEDAAHAFPAEYQGSLIGTLRSDCAVFSFYATKTMATGEGGMVVTRDGELARRMRIMRLHGIDRDAFDRYVSTRPAWYYEVVAPGFKYNMTDIAASLGIQQLRKTARFLSRRKELAATYNRELEGLPVACPPQAQGQSSHAWHLYVIRLMDSALRERDELIKMLFDRGIGCSVHYVPLHLQPYWRERYQLRKDNFPCSQDLFERCVSLPLYTKMTDEEQHRVIAAIKSILC